MAEPHKKAPGYTLRTSRYDGPPIRTFSLGDGRRDASCFACQHWAVVAVAPSDGERPVGPADEVVMIMAADGIGLFLSLDNRAAVEGLIAQLQLAVDILPGPAHHV